MSPAWFNHATVTGALFPPEAALAAGFFDRFVSPDELSATVRAEAQRLLDLNLPAHAGTRLRVRAPALRAIREGIDEELPAEP